MESLTTGPELENPARMFMESLTTGPELENSQGHFRPINHVRGMSVFRPIATKLLHYRN